MLLAATGTVKQVLPHLSLQMRTQTLWTLITALQRTQLSCAWTPDSQNCEVKMFYYFMLLSLW